MKRQKRIQRSGGNVFAKLGVAYPRRVMARARLMSKIAIIIKERGLTQKAVGELLKVPQPKVSALMNGKLSLFSLDVLLEFLKRLDCDVEIVIRDHSVSGRSAGRQVIDVE